MSTITEVYTHVLWTSCGVRGRDTGLKAFWEFTDSQVAVERVDVERVSKVSTHNYVQQHKGLATTYTWVYPLLFSLLVHGVAKMDIVSSCSKEM